MTLDIRSGETVSVVGRTGSGKSSLILTLLRLLELEKGQIIIDGLDAARISRRDLRAAILTIPQEPVEMPGSVRFNLTAFASASKTSEEEEKALKGSLERVGLWEAVRSRGGLDTEMGDVGFSGGQKQLLALARAIVSARHRNMRGGIILLDEPTSSVDEATSAGMWRVLKDEFCTWTIVAVTHSNGAAGEADLLLRMDGGQVTGITRKAEDDEAKE